MKNKNNITLSRSQMLVDTISHHDSLYVSVSDTYIKKALIGFLEDTSIFTNTTLDIYANSLNFIIDFRDKKCHILPDPIEDRGIDYNLPDRWIDFKNKVSEMIDIVYSEVNMYEHYKEKISDSISNDTLEYMKDTNIINLPNNGIVLRTGWYKSLTDFLVRNNRNDSKFAHKLIDVLEKVGFISSDDLIVDIDGLIKVLNDMLLSVSDLYYMFLSIGLDKDRVELSKDGHVLMSGEENDDCLIINNIEEISVNIKKINIL